MKYSRNKKKYIFIIIIILLLGIVSTIMYTNFALQTFYLDRILSENGYTACPDPAKIYEIRNEKNSVIVFAAQGGWRSSNADSVTYAYQKYPIESRKNIEFKNVRLSRSDVMCSYIMGGTFLFLSASLKYQPYGNHWIGDYCVKSGYKCFECGSPSWATETHNTVKYCRFLPRRDSYRGMKLIGITSFGDQYD